jgi:histidinol-phosphate aminotransferase
LVAEPTFSMYDILARTLGIPVVKVARDHNFQIDLAAATEAIADNSIKAVFLVHPNSPTGNLLNAAELDWVRSLSPNILVVIDEAYFEFANSSLVHELTVHPNWVILRTFSKAFRLAAYRVGYAIAAPELILALEKVRLPYNLPAIAAVAAELAMIHRQELLANIPEILSERDRLFQAIQSMGIKLWNGDANFLYLRTGNDKLIMESLKAQGTLIRQTGGGLRLTIGTVEQNQRTLERFKNALL